MSPGGRPLEEVKWCRVAVLGSNLINATPPRHVNPPPIILSQGKDVLARKPLFQTVALDLWFVRRGIVHPPYAALAGSDPQSSLTIQKQRIDRSSGNSWSKSSQPSP